MRTTDLLHFAFRARDPLAMGLWYAELFEGQFFVHPVLSGLGVVCVKLNHPEGIFRGLLEFWPWDILWDGAAAVFRRVEPRPSPTSYGHVAVKVQMGADAILAELKRRGIPCRLEPRGAGITMPVIDDPEGNMVELFPNIEHIDLPASALCSRDQIRQVMAEAKARLDAKMAGRRVEDGIPLLIFESA